MLAPFHGRLILGLAGLAVAALVTSGPAAADNPPPTNSAASAAPQSVKPPPLVAPAGAPPPDPAANRVVVTYLLSKDGTTNDVRKTLSQRLVSDFSQSAQFTAVPIDAGVSDAQAYTPGQLCYDNQAHAVLYVAEGGSTGGDVSNVHADLRVRDCSGTIVFFTSGDRRKVTTFTFKGYRSIAKDLGLDLMADFEKQLEDFKQKHCGLWSSLMTNGVAADPQSDAYLSLVKILKGNDGAWSVAHVFSGGPADVAGLRVDDAVTSIDATTLTPSTTENTIETLQKKQSYAIVVRRRGQEFSLQVFPKRYDDLMPMLKKNPPKLEPSCLAATALPSAAPPSSAAPSTSPR